MEYVAVNVYHGTHAQIALYRGMILRQDGYAFVSLWSCECYGAHRLADDARKCARENARLMGWV